MGARALVWQWLLRALLLLFWSLVGWGALLALVSLVDAASEGLRPALVRLLPSRGASIWAWLNGLSVALALAVGILAAGYLAWTRRGRPAPPSP
jgi:hypothetical protein